MITFAVCDDEPLMARELAGRITDYMSKASKRDCSVSSFSNGRALLERAGSFDVIFLDVQMEQPDGMETARLLRRRGDHALLVFVTVLKECVFDSFQVEAFDYLLKPLDGARFDQTMDRLLRSLEPAAFGGADSFFALCTGCYRTVGKLLAWTEDSQTPSMELLLFPILFFFAAELYILQSAYSFFAPVVSLEEAGRHGTLLLLQVLGLAALLCTLYAYRRLCQGFRAQAELQSLTQAAHAQKVYMTEAQARYEQTKSFRHDVKNHLSLLDGLLRRGKLEEGREYLKKLEAVSEALSFPYQTGNPMEPRRSASAGGSRGISIC